MYSLGRSTKTNSIEARVRKLKKRTLEERKRKDENSPEHRYLTHKIGVLNEVLGL